MSEIKATYLKGNRAKTEFRTWSKWLDAAALLADRFSRQVGDDDPFAYNETASVSVLAAAAACAGFVGLAEFSTDKAAAKGKGRSSRPKRFMDTGERDILGIRIQAIQSRRRIPSFRPTESDDGAS